VVNCLQLIVSHRPYSHLSSLWLRANVEHVCCSNSILLFLLVSGLLLLLQLGLNGREVFTQFVLVHQEVVRQMS
jgi:hypothetical protein